MQAAMHALKRKKKRAVQPRFMAFPPSHRLGSVTRGESALAGGEELSGAVDRPPARSVLVLERDDAGYPAESDIATQYQSD